MSYRDDRFQNIVRAYDKKPEAELKAEMARHDEESPERAAFEHLLSERQEAREDTRHIQALAVAKGANHIAKWAIFFAVLALIITVVLAFWR
jgi:hypothetical protein